MTKIVKGGKKYPFITGDDVLVTKNAKHPLETVDERLDEQEKEIGKLKSNLKYVYSYGGVGGKGSGGSGGGSSTGNAVPFASLNKRQLQNDGNTIILSGPGSYTVNMSVSNSQGRVFYVEVLYGNRTKPDNFTLSTEKNRCKESYNITLNTNGRINVSFYDDDGNPIASFEQYYIVNPHSFETKFMYEFDNGVSVNDIEFNPYEYFVGNSVFRNPFILASYQIDVQNVSNVSLTYKIGGVTLDPIDCGSNTKYSHKIYLDDIVVNGKPLTHESNTGAYTVSVTLKYTSNATEQGIETKSFDITIVPNHLYINVRNAQNVIYDSLDSLREAIDTGVEGIPEKTLNVGTYTSFYCKVFEGSMIAAPKNYDILVKAYDVTIGHEPGDEVVSDEEVIVPVSRTVKEQQENAEPISVVFNTPGIKMVVFSTKGQKDDIPDGEPNIKYIFVREKSTGINEWYPSNLVQNSFYFRANLSPAYSTSGLKQTFPQLSSGNEPWEISESNSPITIDFEDWGNPSTGCDTTILSFGMQYSAVNKDSSVILKAYSAMNDSEPVITLSSDAFYTKNIFIPTETNFDKTVNNNYHLIQIVRHKIGFINTSTPQWATYLYIDGKLESNNPVPDDYKLIVRKIVFNNVNVIYNLINIQYANVAIPDVIKADRTSAVDTIDGLIYQYYLAYKDIMNIGEVTASERAIYDAIKTSLIKFDGEDVIVTSDFVSSLSPSIPIPTLMMEFTNNDPAVLQDFKEKLFHGYKDNDTMSFGTRDLTGLYWCNGINVSESKLKKVTIPQYNDPDNNESYTGKWQVELQGTSTMKNKIKNFSLILKTDDESIHTKKLLMSPNYSAEDKHTFLPEQIWTLKADIADSAHANNASIGKFVNRVCTPFSTNLGFDSSVSGYIKNTLEGFPILMYFKIGDDVYYLGVYNFNMGRGSYYNLGYIKNDDMVSMKNHIQTSNDKDIPFSYSVGSEIMVDGLAIGEVQDNNPEFDYHQFQHNVLFNDNELSDGRSTMFGKDSKITGNLESAKQTLENFVKSVALAGSYCFANIGKKPKSSKSSESSNNCVSRYELETDQETGKYIECVPDIHYQFRYNGSSKEWFETDYTFDNIKTNDENLLQCISSYRSDGTLDPDYHFLDFKSASEYYTICMAFGLVDSILKNQNIKSWDGKKCYVAFYDMDCALGENNAGKEVITYLAATDYWYSESKNGYLEPVDVKYDYWNPQIGPGFDYPSSYLFAIAKYAQAILGNQDRYPQQFWAEMRQKNGELRSSKYFIDNYFSSGIGEIPAYMASLNYQVKYLYRGKYLDADNNEREGFLANQEQFNGTRIEKVKDWLNKRFHFLDVIFNIQAIDYPIGNGVFRLPQANAEVLGNLSDDVIILSDAFTVDENSNVLISSNDIPVQIKAPKNTPFIANRGKEYFVYILNAETGEPNTIMVNTTATQSSRFLGSTEFTAVSKIEPFLNTSNQISSNRLEEIIYSGLSIPTTNVQFTINSTSIKNIQFNIPTLKGTLMISNDGLYGQSLSTLNISESGLTGTFDSLKNLKRLNISSISSPTGTITVSNCPLIGDGYSSISGMSEDRPTTLNALNLRGVSGNFNLKYTSIEKINLTVKDGETSEFSIIGDTRLNELNLSGFKSIVIRNCPNLEKLTIDETDNNKCEKIIIDIPEYQNEDGTVPEGLKGFKNVYNGVTYEGIFDFTSFDSLKTLGLSGSKAVVIKIPNHKVSIDTFKDNTDLEFIDTAGQNSIIELTRDSSFYKCYRYGMRQSWWSNDDTNAAGESITLDKYTNKSNAKVGNYTRICVSPECISLAHTFDKIDSSISTNYATNPYQNTWGQWVKNAPLDNISASYFINNFVAATSIDGEYIDDDNIIHDTSGQGGFTVSRTDCRANIISLQGCFNMQSGIRYQGSPGTTLPDLSHFTSLTNIAMMYYGTKVEYLSSALLSLPQSLNNNDDLHDTTGEIPDHTLNWYDFIKYGEVTISKDAFKNISYRISDFTMLTLYIKGNGDVNSDSPYNQLVNTEEDGGYLDIVDILCPKKDDDDNIIPFERIQSFYYFIVNPNQYIDYRNLLKVCPNVRTLVGFLNGDLSKSLIDGMLSDTTKIDIIDTSFNHNGDMNKAPTIDLYDFFNWGESKLYTMHNLFTSNNSEIGFSVNKTITYDHFEEILNTLHNFKNIARLSNIFSYCTISGYEGSEIKLGNLEENEVMNKIENVNSLFYCCKSSNDTPLNIGRSFFECLPNVKSAANTFGYVEFAKMLTYDFFCKRKYVETSSNIYVEVDPSKPVNSDSRYANATLRTISYGSNLLTNLDSCFRGARFKNCECWFDPSTEENTELRPLRDVVTYNGDSSYTEYYKKESGRYVKYSIGEAKAYADTLNNFTNYVSDVRSGDKFIINNHNISNDLFLYRNNEKSDPYDTDLMSMFNISPTYCCLPPDLLHCCYYECDLSNLFADTNIIGVIPQHLVEACWSSKFNNMFKNVNILPNLIYHYDSRIETYDISEPDYEEKRQKHLAYIDLISSITVDNESITTKTSDDNQDYTLVGTNDNDATVLFRNSDGELRRRYPISGMEYNKSQFVYVPQGYTMNKDLTQAFTFRYNLPAQVDLYKTELSQLDIEWPANDNDSYSNEYSPEQHPELWPYYTQYFFTVDESVEWNRLYNMSSPFISDGDDVSFDDDTMRLFSTNEDYNNRWWGTIKEAINYAMWHDKTSGIFNVFLNLCGKRNTRTGQVKDYGCPIKKAIDNNYVVINGFVGGILTIFLNGRIFEETVDGGKILPRNGSIIIDYTYGFGRNMIFPYINTIVNNHPRVLLNYANNNVRFYRYMFPSNYDTTYGTIFGTGLTGKIYDAPKYILRT